MTIVFENEIVEPRRPGEDDTVEVVTRNIEYSRSGRYSYELSDGVLQTARVIAARPWTPRARPPAANPAVSRPGA